MERSNLNSLRVSGLKKLSSDEAAALLGPFVALGKAPDSKRKSEVFKQVAQSYSDGIGLIGPLKFQGPHGELWTEAEWVAYVSEQLGSRRDLTDFIDELIIQGI